MQDSWQARHNQLSTLASNLGTSYAGLDGTALVSTANYDRPIFENFAKTFGYSELKLVSKDGQVLFSLQRGSDYQQNLGEAAWRDTPLGRVVRAGLDSGRAQIGDLAVSRAGAEPSQFLAAPILDEGELQLLLVLELPLAELNRVMQARQGLGEAGETYLVGPDGRLRSDSIRFADLRVARDARQPERLPGAAISRALEGQQGRLAEAGLNGQAALKAFVPLQLDDQRWALVAEMDQEQAFAPVRALMWQVLLLVALTIAGVAVATWRVSRSVMRPLGGEPRHMAELARRNMALNGLAEKIQVQQGDYRRIGELYEAESFDLVLVNPPYRPVNHGQQNALRGVARARHEVTATLADVVRAARYALKFRGRLAMVHLPERLGEILVALHENQLEAKRLCFVQPKADKDPNMVLIEAVVGAAPGGLKVERPLIVHGTDGSYTEEVLKYYE